MIFLNVRKNHSLDGIEDIKRINLSFNRPGFLKILKSGYADSGANLTVSTCITSLTSRCYNIASLTCVSLAYSRLRDNEIVPGLILGSLDGLYSNSPNLNITTIISVAPIEEIPLPGKYIKNIIPLNISLNIQFNSDFQYLENYLLMKSVI